MSGNDDISATAPEAGDKTPRTARGQKTLRAILDAAAAEFGDKGFHEGSISGITRRAGVALGSFYTYFNSKDEVFRALVKDMSAQVGAVVAPAVQGAPDTLSAERRALRTFLAFAREHKEIYRIIDEAEFVDAASYRLHYESTAARIAARLANGAARGEVRGDIGEIEAWAIMGMNVFLGLRFGVWDEHAELDRVAAAANRLIADGLRPATPPGAGLSGSA